jgi:hypothetical protein
VARNLTFFFFFFFFLYIESEPRPSRSARANNVQEEREKHPPGTRADYIMED